VKAITRQLLGITRSQNHSCLKDYKHRWLCS